MQGGMIFGLKLAQSVIHGLHDLLWPLGHHVVGEPRLVGSRPPSGLDQSINKVLIAGRSAESFREFISVSFREPQRGALHGCPECVFSPVWERRVDQ